MFGTAPQKASIAPKAQVLGIYAAFFVGAVGVFHLVGDGEFSCVLTLSAVAQCLAFALLAWQVLSRGSTGVSARSLGLDAFALCCRLSSTTWLNGYLPADASGDYVYQIVDVLALVMVLWLLRQVLLVRCEGYEEIEDSFPAVSVAVVAVVLATILHSDLNDRPLFDTLWMSGLFVSAVSALPQLWLMTHSKAPVEPLTSHFMAVMAISRVLSGTYMWHAHEEISSEPWIEGFNHAGWAVLGAHFVHLLLLADFAYFYVKAVSKHGFDARLELPLHLRGSISV